MAKRDFFLPDARRRVAEAVEGIERQTAAEVVVAVRLRSGHYRQTDLYAGAALALATLLFLLFDERSFAIEWMPANVIASFLIGAVVTARVESLRRLLTSRRLLRERAGVAAKAAFYDMGISRTRGRTGVLVFVSMFERRVEVVPDIGVQPAALGAEWSAALAELEAALVPTPDLERFLGAMAKMAAPLARALPIQDDDENELPNEPVMS